MESCCLNSYRVCHPFVGCPVELVVKVPASYTEPTIRVRIVKANTSFEVTVDVDSGFATIDLINDAPDGFVNGFGAMYELMLIDPNTNELVQLQTTGDPVVSIVFTGVPGVSDQPQFLITY